MLTDNFKMMLCAKSRADCIKSNIKIKGYQGITDERFHIRVEIPRYGVYRYTSTRGATRGEAYRKTYEFICEQEGWNYG